MLDPVSAPQRGSAVSGDAEFLADLTLRPVGGGRYEGVVSDCWSAPVNPQGGVTTAVALRAAEMALGRPDQSLRTATALFASQLLPGRVEVDVEVVRAGRSVSQTRSTIRAAGSDDPGHTVIAAWGLPRRAPDAFRFTGTDQPTARPLAELLEGRPAHELGPPEGWSPFQATFFTHFDSVLSEGHLPWVEGWGPGEPRRVHWFRWLDTPRLADGTVDPLALLPMVDMMPGAVGEKVGPTYFMAPSVDLTVHLLEPSRSDWHVQVQRARHAGDGYASGELELWSDEGRLVAYATQVMLLSFPETGT